MKFFAKAVLTGFALAMGSALFKKIAPYVRLDEKDKAKDATPEVVTGVTHPELHREN